MVTHIPTTLVTNTLFQQRRFIEMVTLAQNQARHDSDAAIREIRHILRVNKLEGRIVHRIKSMESIWCKMCCRGYLWEQIHDIGGIRIIVPTREACHKTLEVIESHWRLLPGSFDDYLSIPKPNTYEALHATIHTGSRGLLEIQIRSQEMDANAVCGRAAHWHYKNTHCSMTSCWWSGGCSQQRRA